MASHLKILTSGGVSENDARFIKLAEFLGIGATVVHHVNEIEETDVVGLSASVLEEFVEDAHLLEEKNSRVLVYGFTGNQSEIAALRSVTRRAITNVRAIAPDAERYAVSVTNREITGPFSGLDIDSPDPKNDLVFTGESESFLSIDDQPFFCRWRNWFYWGTKEVADLDIRIEKSQPILSLLSRFLPGMQFVKHCFGARCWHNPAPSACFIIDDPWLRNEYGFVNYRELLDSMQRKRFATSIAFIPWNYRRSTRGAARSFLDHPDRLSLNVHGCDHTRAEFATSDPAILTYKLTTALLRMEKHEESQGVPFDRIMVFPQGIFSRASLKKLDEHSFLAAVNTSAYPVDQTNLKLRTLLSVTVDEFEGTPLFTRYYPDEIADFALALFLGKPVFVVEHHEYFKGGLQKLEKFVDEINSLEQNLKWLSLSESVRTTNLQRVTDEGSEVRIFTNQSTVCSRGSIDARVLIKKRKAGSTLPSSIKVQDDEIEFRETDEAISFHYHHRDESPVTIKIECHPSPPVEKPYQPKFIERLKIGLRRYLCDFRDIHISKTGSLFNPLERVVTLLFR